MGLEFRPLDIPTKEYSPEAESLFRRQLENYLLVLSAGVSEATDITGPSASLASKRERFITPAIGVVTVSGP